MRAHVGMEGIPIMNFIKLSKKWSGQNRPSMTGSKKENPGTPRRSIVQIRRASQRKRELPLPMPFELPTNFNVSIQQCLDKEHLTGKAWSKFITAIAHCIFKHKSYPTQDEYKHVAEMMVKKWKFLQTKAGYVSSSCAPYFKFSGDISHEQHLMYLAAECCKVKPNPTVTQQLMKRTFALRQKEIKEDRPPVNAEHTIQIPSTEDLHTINPSIPPLYIFDVIHRSKHTVDSPRYFIHLINNSYKNL